MSSTPPLVSPKPSVPRLLLLVGGAASAMLFVAFLIGALGTLRSSSTATDNWLIILIKINFRPSAMQPSALGVVSLLDIGLMFLFGVVMAAMYPALSFRSRAWAAIAVALPLAGIPVFLATASAGRSAVLLAGLISSFLSLRAQFGSRLLGWAGLFSSAILLFVGDFGTAALPPSSPLAVLIAVGYILWSVWLLLVSIELIERSRHAAA